MVAVNSNKAELILRQHSKLKCRSSLSDQISNETQVNRKRGGKKTNTRSFTQNMTHKEKHLQNRTENDSTKKQHDSLFYASVPNLRQTGCPQWKAMTFSRIHLKARDFTELLWHRNNPRHAVPGIPEQNQIVCATDVMFTPHVDKAAPFESSSCYEGSIARLKNRRDMGSPCLTSRCNSMGHFFPLSILCGWKSLCMSLWLGPATDHQLHKWIYGSLYQNPLQSRWRWH